MNKIWQVFKRKCKHESTISEGIETGKLSEPGEPSREVQIRLVRVKCKKCDKTLRIIPHGIVHDPKFDS